MKRRILLATSVAIPAMRIMMPETAEAAADPQNTLDLDLKCGRVVIQLLPDIAPKAAARLRTLADQGFYDNTPFHRVIEGFMAQGGDPTGSGTGGSPLPDLPAEFTNRRRFLRGTVGMARTSDPNSANSQFFIMFGPSPSLDGQYTIVGQVISGMDCVDQIKRGSGASGMVSDPDRIVRVRTADQAK